MSRCNPTVPRPTAAALPRTHRLCDPPGMTGRRLIVVDRPYVLHLGCDAEPQRRRDGGAIDGTQST